MGVPPWLWKPQVESSKVMDSEMSTESRGNSTASRLDVVQRSHFLTGLTFGYSIYAKNMLQSLLSDSSSWFTMYRTSHVYSFFRCMMNVKEISNMTTEYNSLGIVLMCIAFFVTIPPGHVHGEHLARRILDILWNRRTWGTEPLSQDEPSQLCQLCPSNCKVNGRSPESSNGGMLVPYKAIF